DHATGRLEPSYDAIAVKAGVCRRAVATALKRLRDLGLLYWQRRARSQLEDNGGFRLGQETNAYARLPPSHWEGHRRPPAPPPPEPGTWGDHPPLPDPIAQAVEESRAQPGAVRTVLSLLDSDPGDSLAKALASLGRAVFSSKS